MMRAGKLNKRITLQYPIKVSDGMGGYEDTWVDITPKVWASIWPTKAADFVSADATTMNITHRIQIRYRSDIKSNWRIKYGGAIYRVISGPINTEMRNEKLDILCNEVK